jgi:hypothetical protein
MTRLIILVSVLMANVAFAQTKKLEKLYQKKQFDKLLSKTEKLENKGKIDAIAASSY